MLNGKLVLHDIQDTEGFCATIIGRCNLELTASDYEDLLTFLIEAAWLLSAKQDPERGKFSIWAGYALRRSVADWQRQRYGRTVWKFSDRTYIRERVIVSTLDAGLELIEPGESVDDRIHSELAVEGVLRERGSESARRDLEVGKETPRRAA